MFFVLGVVAFTVCFVLFGLKKGEYGYLIGAGLCYLA